MPISVAARLREARPMIGIPLDLLVLLGGAFLVAFAVGVSGFADALVASAIWLHAFPAAETVPLVFLTGILVHGLSVTALVRGAMLDLRRLAPFVVGGIAGIPAGLWALGALDPVPLRRIVGGILIAVCAWQLLRLARGASPAGTLHGSEVALRAADGGVGLLGGALGGLAGLSGLLPTLWCGVRGWPSDEQRRVYQPYILTMHVAALALALGIGAVPGVVFERFAWCLPFLLGGLFLGHAVYRRIDQRTFRFAVLALLLASGLTLVR